MPATAPPRAPRPRRQRSAPDPAGRPGPEIGSPAARWPSATACRAAGHSRPTSGSRARWPSRPTTSSWPRAGSRAGGARAPSSPPGPHHVAPAVAAAPRAAGPRRRCSGWTPALPGSILDTPWPGGGRGARCPPPTPPRGYDDPRGLPELRAELAAHVARTRGLDCDPEELVVTAGTVDGLRHVLTVLPPGPVALEDPGYRAAAAAIVACGTTGSRPARAAAHHRARRASSPPTSPLPTSIRWDR